jgi:hypothetical protein
MIGWWIIEIESIERWVIEWGLLKLKILKDWVTNNKWLNDDRLLKLKVLRRWVTVIKIENIERLSEGIEIENIESYWYWIIVYNNNMKNKWSIY